MLLHHGNRSAIRTPLPPPHATTSLFGVPVLTSSSPTDEASFKAEWPKVPINFGSRWAKQRAKAIASGLLSHRFATLALWWHPGEVCHHLMRHALGAP